MAGKLAIMGGTFDPIHFAHLRTALEALEALDLGTVKLMPCNRPPHGKDIVAGMRERLAMIELAVGHDPRFEPYDLEARLGGVSRSVRTLKYLCENHRGREIYFILGSDAFFTIHQWHDHRELMGLANFVILGRPGTPNRDVLSYLEEHFGQNFRREPDGWVRHGQSGCGFFRVATTLLNISSSRIKKMVAAGNSISFLVPEAVEEYIRNTGLYQTGES